MDTTTDPISYRRELLQTAADLIDGDRNVDYGDPIDDFRRTSRYWNTHISGVMSRFLLKEIGLQPNELISVQNILVYLLNLLEPHDVAIMMGQLKDSRLAWSPEKGDHWVDKAGYAGCGYDCVQREDLL